MSDPNSSSALAKTSAANPSLSERVRSLRLPDRPPRGWSMRWLPWALCGALLVAVVVFATRPAGSPATDPSPGQGPGSQYGKIAAKPAGDGKKEYVLQSKGYIIPVSLIQVSPIIGGKVMKLYIQEGDKVDKGKLLAEIEDTEYDADYKRTAASLEAAKHRWHELWKYREDEIRQADAELSDAKAQRDQLFLDYKRSLNLKNANAIGTKEFEQAESAYKSMEFRVKRFELSLNLLTKGPRDERIAAAKAEVGQAEAELIRSKWRLDNCKVYAPITGIILSKKAEEGNQVNPSAFSNGLSASLCEMADLTNMEVDLAIAERDIAKVFKGQKCEIKAEAYPEHPPWEGEVSRIMPTADRSKGAIPVRVKIMIPRSEEGQYLRPEMGAVVSFLK